jgi:hypothetical protein
MLRSLIAVFLIIILALVFLFYGVGTYRVEREDIPPGPRPHAYGDPSRSLQDIRVTAFYFVPKNKSPASGWHTALARTLEKLKAFHEFQFLRTSSLTFEIFPLPVIGLRDNLVYDTESTQHGNPEGLRNVVEELEERGFFTDETAAGGKEEDSVKNSVPYEVKIILYEGVGASGAPHHVLISRLFLTNPEYREGGTAILAHEFYHALGAPDGYRLDTGVPTDEDIMGLGYRDPIERAFLKRDTLKKFGL